MISSDIRIGTPALAARGFGNPEFRVVADFIAEALVAAPDAETSAFTARVDELARKFPLYPDL